MKKNLAYASIVAFGLAFVLNLLFITDVMTYVAVQVGSCVVALAITTHSIVFYKRKDSPIYWKNWKKNPIIALSFCVLSLAFIITLTVALFSRV